MPVDRIANENWMKVKAARREIEGKFDQGVGATHLLIHLQ